jgi:hypothetical protein
MKKIIMGTFRSRQNAEALIKHLRESTDVPADDISYIYKNTEGEVKEVSGSSATAQETTVGTDATTGAMVGGSMGALAGVATVAGVIPVIGPIFAAGPLIAALGLGAGAVGLTAAGALTGAIAGGIAGALISLGASQPQAEAYAEQVRAGDVLVVTHAPNEDAVVSAYDTYGAASINVYAPVAM